MLVAVQKAHLAAKMRSDISALGPTEETPAIEAPTEPVAKDNIDGTGRFDLSPEGLPRTTAVIKKKSGHSRSNRSTPRSTPRSTK